MKQHPWWLTKRNATTTGAQRVVPAWDWRAACPREIRQPLRERMSSLHFRMPSQLAGGAWGASVRGSPAAVRRCGAAIRTIPCFLLIPLNPAQMERRDRLRKLCAELEDSAVVEAMDALEPVGAAPHQFVPSTVFYTEGPPELQEARVKVFGGLCPFPSAHALTPQHMQSTDL